MSNEKLAMALAVTVVLWSGCRPNPEDARYGFTGASSPSRAQETGQADNGRIIFDAGVVDQDQSVTHAFSVHNSGPEPLRITRARTSCSCTAAISENHLIPPGETTEVKVTFHVGRRSGKVSQQVFFSRDRQPDPQGDPARTDLHRARQL